MHVLLNQLSLFLIFYSLQIQIVAMFCFMAVENTYQNTYSFIVKDI